MSAGPDFTGPYEGVPEHLADALKSWLLNGLSSRFGGRLIYDEDAGRVICLRLRITPEASYSVSNKYIAPLVNSVGDALLDVIDQFLALRRQTGKTDEYEVAELETLLSQGGSAYRVADDFDGLEERVISAVRDAARQSIADAAAEPSAGSAADHLASAWQAAYGRAPDRPPDSSTRFGAGDTLVNGTPPSPKSQKTGPGYSAGGVETWPIQQLLPCRNTALPPSPDQSRSRTI